MRRSSRKAKRDTDRQREVIDIESMRLDNAFKVLELRAGYVQLVLYVVLSVTAVALATMAIVSLARGTYWVVVPTAGASSGCTAIASTMIRRLIATESERDRN